MKITIADNALSNKRGRVIIGLLGEREHTVVVTPLEQPVLQLRKPKYSLEAETEIVFMKLTESNCKVNCLWV